MYELCVRVCVLFLFLLIRRPPISTRTYTVVPYTPHFLPGRRIGEVTEYYIAAMHADERALGVQPPDREPRATQYVGEMLDIIGRPEHNGLAYRAEDGDVNYAVRGFAGYGKLSGKALDDLRAGEREIGRAQG